MLDQFRSYSTSIVTKILLVLLIASFALWGIGDVVMRGVQPAHVATVGDEVVSVQAFSRELAAQTEQIRRSLGTSYSPALLDRLNVPHYVLQRLIQQSLLAQEAQRIGFLASDAAVAQAIRDNPLFANKDSAFEKSRFEAMLRGQGYSEKAFVEKLRREITTDELLHVLDLPLSLPESALPIVVQAEKQPRNIALYRVRTDQFTPKTAPTDAELVAFHTAHASEFTAPEYRSVSYMALKDLGDDAQATLNKVEDALAGGSTLAELAKEMKLSLGKTSKFDAEGRNESGDMEPTLPSLTRFVTVAFATDEQAESSLISSKGGEYYVLRVDALTPAKLIPLATIRPRVLAAYNEQHAKEKMAAALSKIEAEISQKKPVADIIKSHALGSPITGEVSRADRKLDTQSLPTALVDAIFAAEVGMLTSPVRDKSGDYLLAQVLPSVVGEAAPAASDSEIDKLKQEYATLLQEEVMSQYLRHLQTRYPVTIDQDTLSQLLQQRDAAN